MIFILNLDKLLQISTYAGRIMLENGAEIYRVEETVVRICHAYGITDTDSFVTPTGMMVSISDENTTLSSVKRIKTRGVDLNKIDKVNDLARRINTDKISLNDFYDALLTIENEKKYSNKLIVFISGLSAASFSITYGGNFSDFFAAFFIGYIIKLMSLKFQRLSINDFFINFTGGFVVSLLAVVFHLIIPTTNIDKTIIGAIMLLVPGMAITNAIRDIIAGDFLAGLTKGAEAFLIAVSIAAGSGILLSFWINTIGGL